MRSIPRSTRRSTTLLACLVALFAMTPRSGPARAEERPSWYGNQYSLDVLEPEAAEAIAWRHCPAEGEGHCRVAIESPSRLFVEAEAPTHRRIAHALAEAQRVPSAQIFQVDLLVAERNGDQGLGGLSEGARRALADARSLLPYTGYKSLGTGLLRTNDRATAIINGPGDADYRCGIHFQNSVSLDGRRLVVRRFSLARLPAPLVGSESAETKEGVEVLSTSFGMKPGETVVVGTSKLEGADRALVVLLTAKP